MKSELYEERDFIKNQTHKQKIKLISGKRQLLRRGLYGKGAPEI